MSRPPLRLTQMGLINAYLVPESYGLTMIDAGVPGLRRAAQRASARLGLPLRRIVLTHGHVDHVGSVDELLAALPGTELLMHEADLPFLVENGVQARPTTLLRGGERVGSLRVIASPGHAQGHLAFFDQRGGVLYAGDAFVNVPALHVVSVLHPLFPLPTFGTWDSRVALESARSLADVPAAWLACGHGLPLRAPAQAMRRAVRVAESAPAPSALALRVARPVGRLMEVLRPS